MIFKKKNVMLSALAGVIMATSLGIVPANADDSFTVATLSSDESQQCLDTSAQKEYNNKLKENRVVMPMAEGNYSLTSPYGGRISPIDGDAEIHSGTDFAGPNQSPIYSVAAGTVMAAGPTYYLGQWVIVRHNIDGKIYDSVYGHLTAGSQVVEVGDKVEAGELIALEGSTGLSTAPHLHIEIWENGFQGEDGFHIDALEWLKDNGAVDRSDTPSYKSLKCAFGAVQDAPNVAWGGHQNGEIPASSLTTLEFNKGIKLANQAAQKMMAMNKAFKKEFGEELPLVQGYESIKEQKANKKSETIPGKSFFGWGKSVEMKFTHASNSYMPLVSEPDYFTDKQYKWLANNGDEYGWINPAENQKDGSRPNPGLWVYSEQVNNTNSAAALRTYAWVNSMTHEWNSDQNKQCLSELWNKDGNWNTDYHQNGKYGIAKLTKSEINHLGTNLKDYRSNPDTQVAIGLDYISDKYENPCHAYSTWKNSGKY